MRVWYISIAVFALAGFGLSSWAWSGDSGCQKSAACSSPACASCCRHGGTCVHRPHGHRWCTSAPPQGAVVQAVPVVTMSSFVGSQFLAANSVLGVQAVSPVALTVGQNLQGQAAAASRANRQDTSSVLAELTQLLRSAGAELEGAKDTPSAAQAAALDQETEKLEERLSSLEQGLGELASRVRTYAESNNERLKKVDSRLEEHENKIRKLEEKN
jgi:hypothetical protein